MGHVLRGRIVFLDSTIDEGGNIPGSSTGFVCRFRDGKLVQQLIQDLDRFLVFGLGSRRVGWSSVHDVDRGHGFDIMSRLDQGVSVVGGVAEEKEQR